MEGFKEFQGKDLDDAIRQAREYFNVAREKLEIDIVQDAKSGIFGIVGARKALVRARRVQAREALGMTLERDNPPATGQGMEEAVAKGRNAGKADRQENAPASAARKAAPAKKPEPAPAPVAPVAPVSGEEDEEGESQTLFLDKVPEAPVYSDFPLEPHSVPRKPAQGTHRGGHHGAGRRREHPAANQVKRAPQTEPELFSARDILDDAETDGLPERSFEELDQERLESLALETVQRLAAPVVGEARCKAHLADSRVYVSIDCGDDSGILIGREGQTLAAMQYIASRIVSRSMNAAVRVSLDAGDYRRRQDDKLRELALHLADKVKSTGRAYSTRPLSSYHRRIIHLALQEDGQVQTRSTGEGPLKRVVVQRKR